MGKVGGGLRYFGDKLFIPILLAGVAFYLGPGISNHWQNHRQELSTKTQLVADISHSSAELISAVDARDTHPEVEDLQHYLADFRDWQDLSQTIQGKIASYFPSNGDLRRDWIRFATALRIYHALPDQPRGGADRPRAASLETLYTYANTFNNVSPEDAKRIKAALAFRPQNAGGNVPYQTAWRRLIDSLLAQRDAIVAEVVNAKGFAS